MNYIVFFLKKKLFSIINNPLYKKNIFPMMIDHVL